MRDLKSGEWLEVSFTDPGARPDLEAWCRAGGHRFVGFEDRVNFSVVMIRKA